MELKKGYKQTEVGVIPDKWKIMTIDQIFEFHRTSNYSKAQMLTSGEIGCFHYGLIHSLTNNNYDIRTGVKYFVTKQQAKYEFLKEGDVVMVDASEDLSGVNKSIEISGIEDKLYISGLHTYLLRDRGFFKKYFRGPILNSYFTKIQFYRLAVGMKVFGVSKQQLKTVLLPIPPLSEQTAIAQALSDADAYITSIEKLIEKKRQIKQGAMQELLKPKDGWETKRLGEVIRVQGGYAFKSSLFSDNGIPVIRISDVFDGTVSLENCMHSKEINIPIDFKVCNGDVLIAMSGATTGKIGVYQNMDLAYINQRVGKFVILNSKKNSIEFVSHFLNSDKFKSGLIKEIAQGAQPNISGKQIESIEIDIPRDLKIQKEIASTLTIMDEEIRKLELKLQKGKSIKQGMMQNLLTGKIRLI